MNEHLATSQGVRERLPMRDLHARGAGARGIFVTERSMAAYTKAHFIQMEGQKTPVLVRFSPVTQGYGSPETVRDLRSFAVKFYTEEGEYDIVGSHLPVFFIRDVSKYDELLHSLKPLPDTKLPSPDRYWDFMTRSPESVHMLTWLFSNEGTPANYRQMNGCSVHAFKWVNAEGKQTYVKYHWKPKQGTVNFTPSEAAELQTSDFSHATRDLYASIELGRCPQWELYVQLAAREAGEALPPLASLDPTKEWPKEQFPLVKVGTMTLNQNPVNYFLEVEQSAFSAGTLVPGIEPSEDPLLCGLLFTQSDGSGHRTSASHLSIPVHAPNALVSHSRRVSNAIHGDEPERREQAQEMSGSRVRAQGISSCRLSAAEDDFAQAGERYRSLPEEERGWLVRNLVDELRKVAHQTQLLAVHSFFRADEQFGSRIAAGLDIEFAELVPRS
ncbi:catalase [Paenibacillus xylaniclasticus]|uniref:catalase n=1 Tax=Paenibacillus xylaniclasticus TaxID=588083 RepID=UPI000FD8BEF0|nr:MULTISPECIES: catalase [Paenibacillus]GFN32814.1 catalase [Paenibacillus curdlanolyticus]